MSLTESELRVTTEIERQRDALVSLAADLIEFDTTARDLVDPPREEAALQGYLAARMATAGAQIDLWEPRPEDLAGSRMVPTGLGFEGRPQLTALFRSDGRGQSLLLNGHIDTVSSEPRESWTCDPPWRGARRPPLRAAALVT